MPSNSSDSSTSHCCGRGGARPGCGRKPGVKTKPVRLPEWLLEELTQQGDARALIIEACQKHFNLTPPDDENPAHD